MHLVFISVTADLYSHLHIFNRPRFPATTDGTLNKAISLLSDTGYSSDTHNEIFTAVNVLYDKYSALQDSIRQHDTSVCRAWHTGHGRLIKS